MNLGIFTSGGDSPGMNAAIRAVVRTAQHSGYQCFGIHKGYDGMVNNEISPLSTFDVANIIHRGGTILRSARSKEFLSPEGRERAYTNLKKNDIGALIGIGGNGTYAGLQKVTEETDIQVIGLPGTIDNDIFGTDYTIGYDTALNTAVAAIDKIRDTAASHERVFFIEVMGRDAGFIGLNTAIAVGAESVLIPEIYEDEDQLMSYFEKKDRRKKLFSIIIVTEGNKEGNAIELAQKVGEKYANLDIRVSILGHMQRGGTPSAFDRVLASKLGYEAIRCIGQGQTGLALGLHHGVVSKTTLLDASTKHNNLDPELWSLAKILSL